MPKKEPTNINIPIGVLNNVIPRTAHKISDTTSAVSVARKSQKIARAARVFDKISKFKAIVLRIKMDVAGPGPNIGLDASDHAPASWADRIFGANSPVSQTISQPLFQIWARIPELHAGLQPPQAVGENASNEDNWLIDQHDIFTAESSATAPCNPGDIVWVDYGNRGNYSDPIYLGPVISDRTVPKNINGSVSAGEAHSLGSGTGTGKCNASTLGGSSPAGDSLPGSNVPAITSGKEFHSLNDTGKYIWWLYDHQVRNLGAVRSWWMANNDARLRAYTVWAAGYWINKLNAESYITDVPLSGWPKGMPKWMILAQVVWGVMWRECRHNPIGIYQHDPKKAIAKAHATAYGVSQVPLFRFKIEKKADGLGNWMARAKLGSEANNALTDMNHWDLLDPVQAIDFTMVSYIRLFRKYGKSGQHFYNKGGLEYWMNRHKSDPTAKNKHLLGIWWAGSNIVKCTRKQNDITIKGPLLWQGGDKSNEYLSAAASFIDAQSVNATTFPAFAERPIPKIESAFSSFKASFTGTLTKKADPASSKEKKKGGNSTQTPSTVAPAIDKNCVDTAGKPPGHDNESRREPSTPPEKLVIANIDSPWSKGIAFSTYKRKKGVDQIILHESIGHSRKGCARFLVKKGFGVHFIIDQSGGITQHVEMGRATSHAKRHNYRSVGIELINPYIGKRRKSSTKGITVPIKFFPSSTKRSGIITNSKEQLKSLERVVNWVLRKVPTIGRKVPGQRSQEFFWGTGNKWPNAIGVLPHCWVSNNRSDGLFAAHYMWCVLNLGMNSQKAYATTLRSIRAVAHKTRSPRWTNYNIQEKA